MGHAIVRNEPLHGMRLKGHEVMRKEIFALSVESSLSQHENQNEIRLSVNQPNIHYCSHPTFDPFLANLQSLNFRSWTVYCRLTSKKCQQIFLVVEIDKIDSKFVANLLMTISKNVGN